MYISLAFGRFWYIPFLRIGMREFEIQKSMNSLLTIGIIGMTRHETKSEYLLMAPMWTQKEIGRQNFENIDLAIELCDAY